MQCGVLGEELESLGPGAGNPSNCPISRKAREGLEAHERPMRVMRLTKVGLLSDLNAKAQRDSTKYSGVCCKLQHSVAMSVIHGWGAISSLT